MLSALAEDHANARRLAATIREIDGLKLSPEQIDSNIIIFQIAPNLGTAAELNARLKEHGVLMLTVAADAIRAVTHLDVGAEEVEAAAAVLRNVCRPKQ